ncbi:MAG: hypothetical protein MZV70_02920 [Desulfobacterales bacterium]|nr:hypothetical protein [Desulfobacterales bacterium]
MLPTDEGWERIERIAAGIGAFADVDDVEYGQQWVATFRGIVRPAPAGQCRDGRAFPAGDGRDRRQHDPSGDLLPPAGGRHHAAGRCLRGVHQDPVLHRRV